ncbi:mothers against decapentaplegic homolog 6 [Scaptodrosophila lebanonensis]|uniref:Mothers against decapentaplegic homolog n=1 Tax=Drosophila lebanonensis TaxID=7225 RepID=A0A6J2T2T8_DROLE|nr:mothers against decapentaplegic homolog 6 [Scaptodrosophila lebanonensis]XP_030369595.1 mothers against decapentaplegic homolog 6 [Scaptodrosophila lebanonensis]
MIFQKENKKKELLLYAEKNYAATCDGPPTQPPQLPPPPHPHHPQTPNTSSRSSVGSFNCYSDESNSTLMQEQSHTPPPPYSSMSCAIDCSSSERQHQHHQHQHLKHLVFPADGVAADVSVSVTEGLGSEPQPVCTKGGYSCGNFGDDMLVDENKQWRLAPSCIHYHSDPSRPSPTSPATPTTFTTATNFAMSAANIFRNCCGGSDHLSESSSDSLHPSSKRASRHHYHQNDANLSFPTCPNPRGLNTSTCPLTATPPALAQEVEALTKQLKQKQVAALLDALKSRNGKNTTSYLDCILIKKNQLAVEEKHVTVCRLFLWKNLRSAVELKRLPICSSAHDCIYDCCNPLHWYRVIYITDPEPAPPPYQCSKILRLRDADSTEKSAFQWGAQSNSQSFSSAINRGSEVESFTTDGEDRSACAKVWCQIAYWELNQRVGDLFHVTSPVVNVYTDGPADAAGDNMCLRKVSKKSAPSVQHTQQKIGLGITLNLEYDDVWIYNRGNGAIFVDSPTLRECSDRVWKVMPGRCLKAFDTHRAQMLSCKQPTVKSLGPIDRFNIKISFAKGWGNSYRRQDIMGCPCWLEVHFNQLR